jgi:hypothetical protein
MAHAGGRPLKFKSVKELEKKANAYFKETPFEHWTVTGLALALDTDRTTLINYENKAEFFDTIKRFKSMVENSYEISLRDKGRSGEIFALKNFGWRDQQEIDHTTKGDKIQPILGGVSVRSNNSNREDSETNQED